MDEKVIATLRLCSRLHGGWDARATPEQLEEARELATAMAQETSGAYGAIHAYTRHTIDVLARVFEERFAGGESPGDTAVISCLKEAVDKVDYFDELRDPDAAEETM